MSAEGHEKTVRRQLFVALLVPGILLVAVTLVLWRQVKALSDAAEWVDHTDVVIGVAQETLRDVSEQEASLRGYLLTGDKSFVQPIEQSRTLDRYAELRALVEDNPVQAARVDTMRRLYDVWFTNAHRIATEGMKDQDREVSSVVSRRQRMEALGVESTRFLETEQALKRQRTQISSETQANTTRLTAGLLIALAAALTFLSRRQIGGIVASYSAALANEKITTAALQERDWVKEGLVKVSVAVQGEKTVATLANDLLRELCVYLEADAGALYVASGQTLERRATFAFDVESGASESFEIGQGLVGTAGIKRGASVVREVPADYIKVRSGLGSARPAELVFASAHAEGELFGVFEIGFFKKVPPRAIEFLEASTDALAIGIRSALYRTRLRDLLEETQRQTEELQAQQEELRVTNEELEEQRRALLESKKRGDVQQAELAQTNENLEEQTQLLVAQNDDLKKARYALEDKAREVERANRYKSEFLANMSHELRTPLNSSLILAKLLADNKDGNLTPEQVNFAETIYGSGNDLLALINDILDLSKIEAGKMDVSPTNTTVERLVRPLERVFEPIAREKKLELRFDIPDGEAMLETDILRAQQVLKNLLSNALKFTEKGSVTATVERDRDQFRFSVRDTGIGIAADQQETIFEAFRQADGTSNRKYGGTGLGLSISRDLAHLLGGEIVVSSTLGSGSTFTLILPRAFRAIAPSPLALPERGPLEAVRSARSPSPSMSRSPDFSDSRPHGSLPSPSKTPLPSMADDRAALDPARRLVLVVEDDPAFAKIVLDLARELSFQAIVATTADDAMALATKFVPSAVVLDMHLPDHSGLSVLDRLKRHSATRHIPVHCVSVEDMAQDALSMGAIGYARKPIAREELTRAFHRLDDLLSRKTRRVLIVEDEPSQRDGIARLLGTDRVETMAVGTVKEALAALRENTFDCVVTDLTLPDASGFDLLEKMAEDEAYSFPPVIVYTARDLTPNEEQRLRRYSSAIIVKGARSPERLLDEVTLFLHQVESELPPERRRMLHKARDREAVFDARTILIVEDDVRNVFALTSLLEPKGAKVLIARNGREALEFLEANSPGVDLVLMDIMMPEMDGLEAIRRIRAEEKWTRLPIIALTAKAAKDDREQCIAAGANDYAPKPLDVETLLSLVRVWMPK